MHNRTTPDQALVDQVAADLTRYLEQQVDTVAGPVHAIALFSQPDYGSIGVSLGTETNVERRRLAPAHALMSDEEAFGPAFRWYSGEWDTIAEDFCSEPVAAELARLAEEIEAVDDTNDPRFGELIMLGIEIAVRAVARVRIPVDLPVSSDLLCWAEYDDSTHVEIADMMLRSGVTARRLHEVIPMWRSLAGAVRAARTNPAVMARVRQSSTEQPYLWRFTPGDDGAVNELAVRLRSCGLEWHDLAEWSPALRAALAIADRVD